MRERVEDLGRLYELLKQISDHDLFNERDVRNKDFCRYFLKEMSAERQDEFIHKIIYGLDYIEEMLNECISIASGQDILNEIEDDFYEKDNESIDTSLYPY